ncbi:MAG: DnaJ domain-containing protein [Pseudomonadota bacterium]
MTAFLALLGLSVAGLIAFLSLPAATLATIIRTMLPVVLMGAGALLMFAKQAGLGSLMLFGGLALWRQTRGVGTFGGSGGGRRRRGGQGGTPSISTVRSAALEMELNHDSGDMDGMILVGQFEGQPLSDLDERALAYLRGEIQDDSDSLALLDAYLDRRFPTWRENGEFDPGAGQGSPSSAGPMGEQEAYEVLGLGPGATVDEIRSAHRRLMKNAHPDSGGSTFLAAKINEAKDVLLKSHS